MVNNFSAKHRVSIRAWSISSPFMKSKPSIEMREHRMALDDSCNRVCPIALRRVVGSWILIF
jgi:hypothetical protein